MTTEALCFGWIDSTTRSYDDTKSLIWMSPRRPGSGWSAVNKRRIEEAEAADLSAALALLLTAGRPWRLCREHLMRAYPVSRPQRRERFAEVMAGHRDYGAAELEAELQDLRLTLASLSGSGEDALPPERFLKLLRQRGQELTALAHGNQLSPEPAADLAEAIRAQLLTLPQG